MNVYDQSDTPGMLYDVWCIYDAYRISCAPPVYVAERYFILDSFWPG